MLVHSSHLCEQSFLDLHDQNKILMVAISFDGTAKILCARVKGWNWLRWELTMFSPLKEMLKGGLPCLSKAASKLMVIFCCSPVWSRYRNPSPSIHVPSKKDSTSSILSFNTFVDLVRPNMWTFIYTQKKKVGKLPLQTWKSSRKRCIQWQALSSRCALNCCSAFDWMFHISLTPRMTESTKLFLKHDMLLSMYKTFRLNACTRNHICLSAIQRLACLKQLSNLIQGKIL